MKRRVLVAGAVLAGFAGGQLSNWIRGEQLKKDDAIVSEAQMPKRNARLPNGGAHDVALGNALAELLRPQNDLASLTRLGRALAELDSAQIATLLDRLSREDSRDSDNHLAWLFTWWRKRDAVAADAWIRPRLDAAAQDGPTGFTFASFGRGKVILAWAKSDPAAALEFAKRHSQAGLATELVRAAMRDWPDEDYRTRIALLLDFPGGRARDVMLAELHRGWAYREPSVAFNSAESMAPGPQRDKALREILSVWAEKDAPAALREFRRIGFTDARLLSGIFAKYVVKAPADAAAMLDQLEPTLRARCGAKVVEAWAQHDPATALNWALANGIRLAPAFETLSWREHNGFNRSSSGSFQVINPLAKALEKQPDATTAWLRAMPAGAERDRVVELAINASRNVDQALALLSTVPPEVAARTANGIVQKFGDPERAHQWVTTLPAGPIRLAGWAGLGALSSADFEIPTGPERDAYLSGTLYRTGLVPEPEERLTTIAAIRDPVLQRDLLDEIMESYQRDSRAERARSALAKAPFPAEWKTRWQITQ
jgi:hypothetical protein